MKDYLFIALFDPKTYARFSFKPLNGNSTPKHQGFSCDRHFCNCNFSYYLPAILPKEEEVATETLVNHWMHFQRKSVPKKVIYDIGTKFLILECFGHNSTYIAPFSDLIDDPESSRRDLSYPHVKTRLGATYKSKKNWLFTAGGPLGGQHPHVEKLIFSFLVHSIIFLYCFDFIFYSYNSFYFIF